MANVLHEVVSQLRSRATHERSPNLVVTHGILCRLNVVRSIKFNVNMLRNASYSCLSIRFHKINNDDECSRIIRLTEMHCNNLFHSFQQPPSACLPLSRSPSLPLYLSSLFLSPSLPLSLSPSLPLFLYPSLPLSLSPSLTCFPLLYVFLSLCICVSLCLSLSLSVCLSVPVCLSVCTCMSVCMSASLSLYFLLSFTTI